MPRLVPPLLCSGYGISFSDSRPRSSPPPRSRSSPPIGCVARGARPPIRRSAIDPAAGPSWAARLPRPAASFERAYPLRGYRRRRREIFAVDRIDILDYLNRLLNIIPAAEDRLPGRAPPRRSVPFRRPAWDWPSHPPPSINDPGEQPPGAEAPGGAFTSQPPRRSRSPPPRGINARR